MTMVAWLLQLAGPLAIRVLASLGVGFVTFAGVTEAVQGLVSSAQSSWSGMAPAVLGLCSAAGVPAALGILFGAITARTTLFMAASATKLIFK